MVVRNSRIIVSMSSQNCVGVSEETKLLVRDVIIKHNLKRTSCVRYYPGSQAGDGFLTKTIAADIADDENSISLFIKCALSIGNKIHITRVIFANEIYFYNTIYPTYSEFWKRKSIKDEFIPVPACYGFNQTKGAEVLALENLKDKGYTLFDRFTYMNDEHLKLVLRSFAKFHAISFAIKDQQKELHDQFCEKCPNLYTTDDVFAKMISNISKDYHKYLDAAQDKDILDKIDNLHSKVYDHILNMNDYLTDYAILAKLDCWVSNMMLLYKNDDREHPIDLMLIDWQCMTRCSPVHDIGALFYSVASKETVDNYKYYMQIYYEELSKRIKELGSDPDVLYPRSVFEKEWIDYGVYVLGLSLILIKGMLCEMKNAPSFEKDMNQHEMENMFSQEVDNEEEFLMRTKYIIRHMIDIGVL